MSVASLHLSERISRGSLPCAQPRTIQAVSKAARNPRAQPVPMGQNGCTGNNSKPMTLLPALIHTGSQGHFIPIRISSCTVQEGLVWLTEVPCNGKAGKPKVWLTVFLRKGRAWCRDCTASSAFGFDRVVSMTVQHNRSQEHFLLLPTCSDMYGLHFGHIISFDAADTSGYYILAYLMSTLNKHSSA